VQVIDEYNKVEAFCRDVISGMWMEDTCGYAWPQSLINEELKECDFFFYVLHDRWGSDPGKMQKMPRQFREEYLIALDCLKAINIQ
jgi:hypothetical protein